MTLLVRLADGVPASWCTAPLVVGTQAPSGRGCIINTGPVSVIDAGAQEALADPVPGLRRGLVERAVLAADRTILTAGSDRPNVFAVSKFGGDLPNDVMLGLDEQGAAVALVVDMGMYWYEDEGSARESPAALILG